MWNVNENKEMGLNDKLEKEVKMYFISKEGILMRRGKIQKRLIWAIPSGSTQNDERSCLETLIMPNYQGT